MLLLTTIHYPLATVLPPLAGYTADRELEVRRYCQPQILTLPRRFSYSFNLPLHRPSLKSGAAV